MRTALFLLLLVFCAYAANPLDRQLWEQRKALADLEKDLKEQRQRLAELQRKESGVLDNLSVLDRNLGQTREYVQQLQSTSQSIEVKNQQLRSELDSLNSDLALQQHAMRKRMRALYQQGKRTEWEELWRLLQQKEDPSRGLYLLGKILQEDQERIRRLRKTMNLRKSKQQELQGRLSEVQDLQRKKMAEEQGLSGQIVNQKTALDQLRTNKASQQQALQEFEQNQKTMLALIRNLEERRKKEEERRKREAAERKAKAEAQAREGKGKISVQEPKVKSRPEVRISQVSGPKCIPHNGAVISQYGMQEHAVLHTMTRNLGIEIRATRGDVIKAAASGTVVAVQRISGRGMSIIIQHGENTYSVYGHLRNVRVSIDQEVNSCQVIGEAGDDESLNGPKLYFQVSQGVQTVDPLQWLGSKR